MLLSLKVNNCFIYNKETEFSMRANMHYKRFPNNVLSVNNINTLKSAIVFGPNNSGKTNLVNILEAIKNIMLNQKTTLNNNLFSENTVCGFEISFMESESEYAFEAKYDVKSKEYIYERFSQIIYDNYKNKKITDWIVRDTLNDKYICEDKNLISSMKVSSKNNILIHLLDTQQFEILSAEKQIITSFASKIEVVDMNNIPIAKTIEMMKSSDTHRKRIANFVLNSDLSMDDFKYLNDDEINVQIQVDSENPQNIKPQENALSAATSFVEMLHLASVYKGVTVPSLFYDSTGTKKIACIASYIVEALEKGKILVVDELDNSLHFKLTRAIISLFNNDLNTKAQLICAVHDVSLLDCQKLFRKEQIWFAHKDRENAYLYSMAEFTSEKDHVRETSALIEKYSRGVFGALPEPDLFESLLEVTKGNV